MLTIDRVNINPLLIMFLMFKDSIHGFFNEELKSIFLQKRL